MSNASKYRPDIDGLRAIAVLAVVAFHAAPGRLPGGFIGVDVFFVISGFLISSILLNGLKQGRFSILEFYRRRIRRIFPALLTVLLACAIAGWFLLLPDEYKQLGKHIAAGAAFVSNFALWNESGYFDISAMFKPLLHLWSLGIEEQFYIFWPLILWATFRNKWSIPWMICILAVASFAQNIHLTGTDRSSAFYLPFPRFWELLIGAMLACTVETRRKINSPSLDNAQSAVGAMLLLFGFVLIDEKGAFPGWWVLMPVFGSALMISAGPQALLNRWVLSNRMMVWVGLISYPLYLWHWPILSFLRTMEGQEIVQTHRVVAVSVAFVLAWLTYEFIEKPVRHGTRKTVLALLLLMASMGTFGYAVYASDGFKRRQSSLPKVVNAGDIGHAEFFGYIKKNFYPCTPKSIHDAIKPELDVVRCFQSKSSTAPSVALIGDSHAEHLFIGLAEALQSENVVFYPTGGLPFTDNPELSAVFKHVILNEAIDTVMLSAIWSRKLHEPANAAWQADLDATVKKLAAAGKSVYITDDVPGFAFLPNRCKYAGRLGIEHRCTQAQKPANDSYLPIFEALQAGNAGVAVIKTYGAFCAQGQCAMAANGQLYYRDENHLNINGSKAIGKIMVSQMGAEPLGHD